MRRLKRGDDARNGGFQGGRTGEMQAVIVCVLLTFDQHTVRSFIFCYYIKMKVGDAANLLI